MLLKPEEIEELRKANLIVESAVHPDTGYVLQHHFRMSGFVYFNIPILFAMLFTPYQTPMFNATMQWVNQTYNSMLNYGNRNASSTYTQ